MSVPRFKRRSSGLDYVDNALTLKKIDIETNN